MEIKEVFEEVFKFRGFRAKEFREFSLAKQFSPLNLRCLK